MLPPNFLTIPQIQHERHAGSKLFHLTTLLEFLLKIYKPDVAAADEGKEPKVGERVIACQEVFSNFKRVLTALRVRNSFAHVMGNAEYGEQDHRNAVDCLIEAISDVCRQPAIPRDIVAAVYCDPDADFHARQGAEARGRQEEKARIERDKQAQAEQARKLRAEQERLEEGRRQHARRETELQHRSANRVSIIYGLRWALFLGVIATVGYLSWPQVSTWIYGSRPTATVVRTQAELALKNIRLKKKQTEFGASITQAEAAWRDAEIEFKKGNYKQAEEKYRQLLSVWDGVNVRMAETQSFEELQTEANAMRRDAMKAQAQQKAADQWNQAEELRRNAINARRNGNLQDAKNLILQARQQYETAQATAVTAPTENADTADGGTVLETPTVTPASTPVQTPEPLRASPTAFVQRNVEQVNPPSPVPGNNSDDDGIFSISEKEFRRYVTKQVNPVISSQARSAGVSGPVVVAVQLSKQGRISKMWVVEGNMLLRDSALAALWQWSFRPYQLDRVPTDIKSEITIQVR